MKNIKLLLDIGHSALSVGATSADKRITEYEMNVFLANALKKELEFYCTIDIVDPKKDNRVAIGLQAKGYNAFVSLHLNAANKLANYTTVCVDMRHNNPASVNSKLASVVATEIAKSLNISCYNGGVFPMGVMPKYLEVLNFAHRSGCPLCILVEPFFLDVYSSKQVIEEKCTVSMKALASVLRKALT